MMFDVCILESCNKYVLISSLAGATPEKNNPALNRVLGVPVANCGKAVTNMFMYVADKKLPRQISILEPRHVRVTAPKTARRLL